MIFPYEHVGRATGLLSETGQQTSTIFEEMSALAHQYDAINLGQGFPDTDGPSAMLQAAQDAIAEGKNQYATIAGDEALRKAVATHQHRFYNDSLSTDCVLITAGASEAIASAVAAFVRPGDEVIVFEPFYDIYPAAIAQAGAVIKTVPLVPPTFDPDLDALENAFSQRTRMVIFNDPHNPTGTVFSPQTKHKIAQLTAEHDALILQDGVYEHLTFDHQKFSPIFLIPEAKDRTLFVSAISKTCSATGWRIGWVTGPQHLISALKIVKGYFSHSAAAPLQVGAAAALNSPASFYDGLKVAYQQQRDILLHGLDNTAWKLQKPQGTFFAVADATDLLEKMGAKDAVELATVLPREAGVAVVPLTAFATKNYKPAVSTWVRFAFCKRPEVLDAAVDRLKTLG